MDIPKLRPSSLRAEEEAAGGSALFCFGNRGGTFFGKRSTRRPRLCAIHGHELNDPRLPGSVDRSGRLHCASLGLSSTGILQSANQRETTTNSLLSLSILDPPSRLSRATT